MNFITKHIKALAIIVFFLVAGGVFAYTYLAKPYEESFFALDTFISIRLYGKNARPAAQDVKTKIYEIENQLSLYRPDSDVSQFNRLQPGESVTLSESSAALIAYSLELSEKTKGAFDPTLGALTQLWDVKNATAPPEDSEVSEKLRQCGPDKLSLSGRTLTKLMPVSLDLGGIAKGYATDQVRDILSSYGIEKGIVNLGGNVCIWGVKDKKKAWTVGIADPFAPENVYLSVDAANTNLVTSGAYQRYFEYHGERYHHILSPGTGYPAKSDVASSTILSPDAALADALSTAVFVAGAEEGKKLADEMGVDYIIITQDHQVLQSQGVKTQLLEQLP